MGRGVAVALSNAGYRVYATGSNIEHAKLPASVIRMPCDHARDEQTAALFSRIAVESGRLDILVNSGGSEAVAGDDGLSFWQQPGSMNEAGSRWTSLVSQHAARLMVRNRRGLMVNISYWAAVKYIGSETYGISQAESDRMTMDTAYELRPQGVAVVSLYPGLVRTEEVLASGQFDLSNSESPEFTGRVIAALAADPRLLRRSGGALVVAALALEYGIADIDGKQPRPFTLQEV